MIDKVGRDPAHKAWKEARATLKNSRIIARRLRVVVVLSAISVCLLVLLIYMHSGND
jgi:hypothetical protein